MSFRVVKTDQVRQYSRDALWTSPRMAVESTLVVPDITGDRIIDKISISHNLTDTTEPLQEGWANNGVELSLLPGKSDGTFVPPRRLYSVRQPLLWHNDIVFSNGLQGVLNAQFGPPAFVDVTVGDYDHDGKANDISFWVLTGHNFTYTQVLLLNLE